jgi:hypothetical protein
MRLKCIGKGKFPVYAVLTETNNGTTKCEALDFALKANAQTKKMAIGFKVLFNMYAQKGRSGLTKYMFHHADTNNDVYQFIKGNFRTLCFIDENSRMVILSHVEMKKGKSVPTKAIQRVVELRKKYNSAVKSNVVIYED